MYACDPALGQPLTGEPAAALERTNADAKVRLGIRPDDVAVRRGPAQNGAIGGEKFVMKPVGGDTLVDIRLPGEQRILARTRAGFAG